MTVNVIITPLHIRVEPGVDSVQRAQIEINIHAEVVAAETALHQARHWLREHISELLTVATPELVVDESLTWRFEVMLALPNQAQPGSGALYNVGKLSIDGATGAVVDAEALAAELRVHVASIAP